MNQTSKVECPYCKIEQEEDIYDLACHTDEMDGSFPHVCEECKKEFNVEFVYKPYIKTSKKEN